MANPQTQTPKDSPAPAKDPAPAPTKDSKAELEKAQAELEALQNANKLVAVQREIDRLKLEARKPTSQRTKAEAEAKREKTTKETGPDGKVVALYRLGEKSYKPKAPGMPASVLEAGEVVRVSIDRLPGPSMEAVVAETVAPAVAYKKA